MGESLHHHLNLCINALYNVLWQWGLIIWQLLVHLGNYNHKFLVLVFEIKYTTVSNTTPSYMDLLLSIGRDGQLHSSIYYKRDDFNFHIINSSFLGSNILSLPAYGVFISQLIRYAWACSSYGYFILGATRLFNRLLEYVKERLKSSLRKLYGQYEDLTKHYEIPLSRMLNDIL